MFVKGKSGNSKGRPVGAKDKYQADIKMAFESLVKGNVKNIEAWLKAVADKNPAKALDYILRFSEFLIPRMRSMEVQAEVTNPVIHQYHDIKNNDLVLMMAKHGLIAPDEVDEALRSYNN